MNLLDLFSGMGGFHLGLEQAGFKFNNVYFSEIDKHAIANYKYNFPNATHIGSVTDILQSAMERPNVITFGSPCQDFSLAGKRKGLSGTKSSLIEQAIAAVTHYRPDIFIWENVKGTFSSNAGSDFWAIIKAFANIGGYGCEWQLVNTSWLLPQNRERIYLVGHLTETFPDWKPIFPIREDDFASNEKKTRGDFQAQICRAIVASTAKMRVEDTYIVSIGHGFVKYSINDICPTIRQSSFEHNTAVNGVRRLTEIECERLQGFPDNWTQYGNYDGTVKPISKTQRYKMCGNAVTATMVKLIASRILKKNKQ